VTTNRLFIKSTHDEYYIIKIPRPGLKEEIEHGQKLFKSVFVLSTALFPSWLQWIPRFLGSCFDSVSSTFQDETKPLKEAAKMRKFKMLLMLSSVKVPAVKYASEGLLVMDAVTENENFEAYIDREMDDKYMKYLEQITAIENQTFSYDSRKQSENKELALEKLYADNPEDKRKMDTFAKLYGEFLESTVYMALAMKQLHADLHPGNILVKADKGSYSLHLVDWGNTVNVDGMIMDPLFLVAYTALGNSKQIAHRLYNLRDTKSSVTEERIHEIVSSVLVENKLDAKGKTILRKALEFIQGLRQGYDFEASSQANVDSEEQAKTMGVLGSQIMMRLFKETDYIVSGKYIQLFRSALPAAATFIKIASALPKNILIKQSIKNASMGFFMGSLKALILKNPAQLRSLIDEINSGVEDKSEAHQRASVHDDKDKSTTDKSTKEKPNFINRLIPSFVQRIKCEDLLLN
jgi:thiamine kinase-like enzyme